MKRQSDPRGDLLSFARGSLWVCMVLNFCFVVAAYAQIDVLDLAEDVDQVWQAMAVFGVGLVLALAAAATSRARSPKGETVHLALTLFAPIVFFLGFVFSIYATIAVS